MKLGILYPRSNAHAGITADFVDGIKASLQNQQLTDKVQLIAESIGFGGQEKEVYEKAEKLLVLDGVDMLVSYIDLRVLEVLKPLLFSSGTLVLNVNPGANFPQNWVPQPNVLHLTLQHGFLSWLSGKLAAEKKHTKAASVTTFYDCGYLHTSAMVKAFLNGGGHITHNHVNNQRYDDAFEIETLTGYLTADKETDCLLCVFDSIPASLLFARLQAYEAAQDLQLFVSPMMLEQTALQNIGEGYQFNINGYLPWHMSLEHDDNRDFKSIYLAYSKREASIFSLLGWEAGLVAGEIYATCKDQFTDGAGIAAKLAETTIRSPRGEMKLDPETNYFISPVYHCTIPPDSKKMVFELLKTADSDWTTFVAMPNEGVSSGWTNTYLCY